MELNVVFRKSVCSLVVFAFGWGQLWVKGGAELSGFPAIFGIAAAHAAETTSSGTSGTTGSHLGREPSALESYGLSSNAFGKSIADSYKKQLPSWDGFNLNFSAGGSNYSIGKDTLVPQEDGKFIKYSSSEADFEKQAELWDDNEKMDEVGKSQKDALFTEAKKDDPTIEGTVYQILVDEAEHPKEDLSKDASLQKSQDIFDNLKAEIEQIVACKEDSSLASSGVYKHLEDLQTCQQVLDRSQTCTIEHDYSNGAIEYYSGPYNVSECKDGTPWCTQMWLGTVGNNYWGGSCTIYEEDILVRVTNPNLIVSATLDYSKYDDYHQVWIGPENGELEKVWSGPDGNFPPETGGACELRESWEQNPNVDVTKYFQNAKKGDIIHFRTRTSVSGKGEGYSRIRLIYDPDKVKEAEEWTNPECLQAYQAVEDGMAEGTLACTDMPENLDADGCALMNGVKVCRDMLGDPPFDLSKFGIDKMCRKIEVQSNFTFYKGDTGCWTALVGFDDKGKPQYEEVCGGENAGGNLDTCKKLIDRGCVFKKSECTEGMTGASGTCYVNDVTYDCGENVRVGNDALITNYDCKGIACAGETCIDAEKTINTNFGKISALLQMADYMAEDMECTGLDDSGNLSGTENVTCRVFGGKPGNCKVAVGGWQDCCDSPQSAGLSAYISMVMAAKGAHQATANLQKYASDWAISATSNGATSLPQGAETIWNIGSQYTETIGSVTDVLSNGVGYLNKAAGGVFDNVEGIYDVAKDMVNKVVDQVVDEIVEEIKQYLMEMLGEILEKTGLSGVIGGSGGAGVTTSGAVAAEGMAAYAAAAFAVVSWLYLAYQVANLVVMLVYKCEEEEYELNSKRDAKNCHYVGSYCEDKLLGICILKKKTYCCFQSPLSRIVNEQIRMKQPEVLAYSGSGWGSPKHPVCDGIPIEKIEAVNWDLVDLSSWEAMVAKTNNIAQTDADLTIERLTGKGNAHLNFHGDGSKDSGTATFADSMGSRGVRASSERENVVLRNEQALVGQDVDQLRIQARRCLPLYLGNGAVSGADCNEVSNDSVVCRENGHVISCDEIAKDNMMNDLVSGGSSDPSGPSGGKTNQDWADEGKLCFKDGVAIDCTTIWDEDLFDEVIKDFADSIGGSSMGEFICTDKSGTYSDNICEAVVAANSCHCPENPENPGDGSGNSGSGGVGGDFVCRKLNQIIDCAELGIDESIECPPSCEEEEDKDDEDDDKDDNTDGNPPYSAVCRAEQVTTEEASCPENLDVTITGAESCELGTSTSASARGEGALFSDGCSGFDTLTVSHTCRAESSDALRQAIVQVNGATNRLTLRGTGKGQIKKGNCRASINILKHTCSGTHENECTVNARALVYNGSSYMGQINTTLNYIGYVKSGGGVHEEDKWSDNCGGIDEANCVNVSRVCTDAEDRVIDGAVVSRDCWHWENVYACTVDSDEKKQCDAESLPGDCTILSTTCVNMSVNGTCLETETMLSCETEPAGPGITVTGGGPGSGSGSGSGSGGEEGDGSDSSEDDNDKDDPDDIPKEGLSDWIIDVLPTCTTAGSKHREDLATGEIVEIKTIVKICTEEEIEEERKNAQKITGSIVSVVATESVVEVESGSDSGSGGEGESVTQTVTTTHYGFASYVDKDGIHQSFGSAAAGEGIVSLQCWESSRSSKSEGSSSSSSSTSACEVGVDTSKYPQFASADDSQIFVVINGKSYAVSGGEDGGHYWAGAGSSTDPDSEGTQKPYRICSIDSGVGDGMLAELKTAALTGKPLNFSVVIRSSS